jgi:hypothetical protein
MKEFFAAYPVAAWSLVSVMLALVVVVSLWDKIRWWWHNTWYSFPFIGRLASLARDRNPDTAKPGWFKAERALCRDYKKFIRIQDEHDFDEKITYLTKAGDIGRSQTPGWIWLLTLSMVFVEAMGFSYVLAGYTLPGASENLQQTGAYGIAFLISVILVAFTHFAGHELYKSNQIKNARREWIEDNRRYKLTTGVIPLARPQSIDDDQPTYAQLANRVGTSPSYVITAATAIFVVIIACFATYVRGQVLEKDLTRQVAGQVQQGSKNQNSALSGLDMSASASNTIPDADRQSSREADVKAIEDEANLDRHGGWGTFIVLAFVFMFLQLLGVIFGYRWGFAGKNSSESYRAIGSGRYATYADVREHYREIADTAQSKLETLQQKIMDANSTTGITGQHLNKSFFDFMQEAREEEARDRDNERKHSDAKAAQRQVVPMPITKSAPEPTPAVAVEAILSNVGQVIAQLDALADKDAKKALMATLSTTLDAEVRSALKARKEAAEQAGRARDAELEELL